MRKTGWWSFTSSTRMSTAAVVSAAAPEAEAPEAPEAPEALEAPEAATDSTVTLRVYRREEERGLSSMMEPELGSICEWRRRRRRRK